MNAITKIQVEFDGPAAPVQILVRQASATASRLPGVAAVDSGRKYGNFIRNAGSNRRSVEVDRLVARIHEVLLKQGTR